MRLRSKAFPSNRLPQRPFDAAGSRPLACAIGISHLAFPLDVMAAESGHGMRHYVPSPRSRLQP
ncbi:hypothetical protein ACFPTY_00835 [Halomonas beimenensis]|uniref:Uncharacterized protein n=1 Tax=Halomonas beimenensis TaxID=475662 RepID=A0A291P3Q1_9GAMM|nr:hypothetical protein BEI_0511 [Halomonas beimenensis]